MQELVSSRRMPIALRTLAGAQELVVTRAQLDQVGIGWEGVKARTLQGVWRDLGPRAVVLHNGEITPRQRAWVAYLHGGTGAVLARATAAELGGLRGHSSWAVHVAVPHGSEIQDVEHPLVTVRVHQTRHPEQNVVSDRVPRRHDMARAVVEEAAASESTDRALALIAASVQQRLVRPVDLDAFLDTRRTLPRRATLRDAVADVSGGAHSLPELQYARALRAAGLPEPSRQLVVPCPGGHFVLDNEFDPWGVVVEINGRQHDDPLARDHDDARRTALQVRGRLVVDLGAALIRRRPREAVLRTAEALTSRGWVPSARCAAILAVYRGAAA